MSRRPTHGVVIPYQTLLALVPVAEEMAKEDYNNGRDGDYGVHIPLWDADGDGKSVLENRGKQVRVYVDREQSEKEQHREDAITA